MGSYVGHGILTRGQWSQQLNREVAFPQSLLTLSLAQADPHKI